MISKFNDWFVAQFGKPIFKTPDEAQDARRYLFAARQRLAEQEEQMRRHDLYEEHKRAALYAWQARKP